MSAPLDLAALDEAGFEALYRARIQPCFIANENARVEAVASLKRRALWVSLALLALAGAAFAIWRDGQVILLVALFGGALGGVFAYQPLANMGRDLKRAYGGAIAEAIGARFDMAFAVAPAFDRIKALGLVPGFTRSKFEDLFAGDYKGCAFELYEGHLEQRHSDSKGRTRYSTVFRGQLVRMHFPRDFLGVTIVRRDAGVFNMFGGREGLKKVGLEDPVFEKAFEVWGSDQVEARYLLHPVLMQRLLDLESALKGKKLRCAFEGGDLLVAVEGGDLFEPGDLFKPLDDPARARRIVEDIAGVVRVMDQVLTAQARRA